MLILIISGILCILLFINTGNRWFNLIKLILSLLITLIGIKGLINYSEYSKNFILKSFQIKSSLSIDEKSMIDLCIETAHIISKIAYYIPSILCIILFYIMFKVLARRSVLETPSSSSVTVNMTILIILLLPSYCMVCYSMGMKNSVYNMLPVLLKLAEYLTQTMIFPLMVFSVMCSITYIHFEKIYFLKRKYDKIDI